jgi:hypothetical protein
MDSLDVDSVFRLDADRSQAGDDLHDQATVDEMKIQVPSKSPFFSVSEPSHSEPSGPSLVTLCDKASSAIIQHGIRRHSITSPF